MTGLPDPETLAERAAALPAGSVPEDLEVAFGIEVTGGRAHTLRIAGGRGSVEEGTGSAGLIVILEPDAAAEVIAGSTNVQRLLEDGRIRLRGDLGSVPTARALAAIGPLLAPPAP